MGNCITRAGYLAILMYYGKGDKDVQLLIDMINNVDPSYRLFVSIKSEICFTRKKSKQLLKALHNKLINQLKISNKYLSKSESKVILDFLNSPEANYDAFDLQFEDTEHVTEALRAVENRYSFDYGRIMTKAPVSKEAEKLACKIIESHPGCVFELNSDIKLIRPMDKRGVTKFCY